MIESKEIFLTDEAGTEHTFKIGKIPYLAGGRKVCSQFISTAAPKLGDYEKNEELALIMFSYTAVVIDDHEILLKTKALVDNHIPDFLTGMKLEAEILKHNMGFSLAGLVQKYREEWEGTTNQLISKILTALQGVLLRQESQHSTSSEPSTPQKMSS